MIIKEQDVQMLADLTTVQSQIGLDNPTRLTCHLHKQVGEVEFVVYR